MTPDDLRTPRYRAEVANTFAADNSLDADLFVRMLTEDAIFQLGGHPAVHGREAIRETVRQFFTMFSSIQQTLIAAYEQEDVLIYEASIRYIFKDGRTLDVPYANILHFEGDLVRNYRIYLDLTEFGD